MAYIRSVVTFQGTSGDAQDRFQNVFHFIKTGSPTNTDYAEIGAALNSFYTADTGAQVSTLMSYMARDQISASPLPFVTHYELLTGGETGSPEAQSDLLGWSSSVTNDLPHEAAICLSFYSDLDDIPEEQGLTRPASRRRGRIYLGPLNTAALGADGRISSSVGIDMIYAAERLRTWSGFTALNLGWAVYSRTDDQARVVVGGWVDNAFDTQRRRGLDSNTRYTFP